MKQEVARKWVDALRSGEYKRSKGSLKTGWGFCCLGVLCDVHAKEVGGEWSPGFRDATFRYCGDDNYLPSEVVQWSGVNCHTPRVLEGPLADFNDSMPDNVAGFGTIADAIERDWEIL